MPGSTVQVEFEPIQFDYGANRYVLPGDLPDSLLRLIPQHEIRNFIQSANELLEKDSDIRRSTATRRKVIWLMLLMVFLLLLGVVLLVTQAMLNPNALNSVLGWLGIVSIYLSLIVLVTFSCIIFRTENFLGSFDYFTPKIKRIIKEKATRFSKRNVRWVLGTRIGLFGRKVEVYDLLYIYWIDAPIQEKNLGIENETRLEFSTAAGTVLNKFSNPLP